MPVRHVDAGNHGIFADEHRAAVDAQRIVRAGVFRKLAVAVSQPDGIFASVESFAGKFAAQFKCVACLVAGHADFIAGEIRRRQNNDAIFNFGLTSQTVQRDVSFVYFAGAVELDSHAVEVHARNRFVDVSAAAPHIAVSVQRAAAKIYAGFDFACRCEIVVFVVSVWEFVDEGICCQKRRNIYRLLFIIAVGYGFRQLEAKIEFVARAEICYRQARGTFRNFNVAGNAVGYAESFSGEVAAENDCVAA